MNAPTSSLKRARDSWGDDMPEWVRRLAVACDKTSQARVGRRLGSSGTVVNQVLGNRYVGNVGKFETKVRAAYMPDTAACPVLGDVPLADCLDNAQRAARGFEAANPVRARLSRTCPKCSINPVLKGDSEC